MVLIMSDKFNKVKYDNEYQKKNYDRLVINVPKGQKASIQLYAKSQGLSLNAYVVKLIYDDMENNS